MRSLIATALLLVSSGNETECRGCKAIEKPVEANPATVSVPYTLEGRGRAGLKFEAGKCKDGGSDSCDATACKLSGSLKIKNNSAPVGGREVDVRTNGGSPSRTHLKPGESTTIVFGDPTSGQPASISCGEELWIEVASQGTDPSGHVVEATRRFCWTCSKCAKAETGTDAAPE